VDDAAHLRRQYGLITRDQALASGLTSDQIDHRLATGHWSRVARCVYRVATTEVTYEQKALAAVLAAGAGAVASHRTAGVLHQLAGIRPGRIELSIPIERRISSRVAVVHRTRHLVRDDIVRVRRIPSTSVARTIIDLAGPLGRGVTEVLDEALVARRTTLERVHAALARVAMAPGRAGTGALAKALEIWTPGPVAMSVPEIELARRLHAAGLPIPERQHVIRDDGGAFVAKVDVAYPCWRMCFEYDGDQHHRTRAQRARDAAQRNRLQEIGWQVYVDVASGDDVVRLAVRRFGGRRAA
jgi:hypothetical protein